jgi:hypothetical protein
MFVPRYIAFDELFGTLERALAIKVCAPDFLPLAKVDNPFPAPWRK